MMIFYICSYIKLNGGDNMVEEEMEVRIKKALNGVKAWHRIPTSLNGVFLVKTPAKDGKENIMVEVNPKDERGNLMKRRGLFLKSTLELEKFNTVLNNHKLKNVLEALENISGVKEDDKIEPIDI
jgi:hypothetical protein